MSEEISSDSVPAPRPAHSPAYFEIRDDLRAAGSEDGIVLLDMSSGRYHSLDHVGARVFLGLAEGRSRREIVESLVVLFDAPEEQVRGDVDALLESFVAAGFLSPSAAPPSRPFAITPALPGRHPAAFPTVKYDADASKGGLVELAWLMRGFMALVYIDWLTRRRRFPGVARAIEKTRPADSRRSTQLRERITAAVNRAASFYYRRRWCLQRSAACAYLLRRHGFAAELVLGVQVMPFIAHAWVEMEGEVVNDNPELTQAFSVLHRL